MGIRGGIGMTGRDELIREIQRLQGLLDEVQRRLLSVTEELQGGKGADVMVQARVDEAYAQLEIAKRGPTADAWQALQKATAAVRPFERRRTPRAAPRPPSMPSLRLTLFTSMSGPSLRALRAADEVARQLGDRASVDICDVARDPERAERAGVVFTPVLRVECAGRDPLTIFGALDDPRRLLERIICAGLAPEGGTGTAAGVPAAESDDALSGGEPREGTG